MKLYRAAPLLWLAMLCVVAAAADDVTVTTREELIGAVRKARPGTKILLAPGTYAMICPNRCGG